MKIDTLNVDGEEIKVTDLPLDVQRLVALYETTHSKRQDVETEHAMLSAALRMISTDITSAINDFKATKMISDESNDAEPASKE